VIKQNENSTTAISDQPVGTVHALDGSVLWIYRFRMRCLPAMSVPQASRHCKSCCGVNGYHDNEDGAEYIKDGYRLFGNAKSLEQDSAAMNNVDGDRTQRLVKAVDHKGAKIELL